MAFPSFDCSLPSLRSISSPDFFPRSPLPRPAPSLVFLSRLHSRPFPVCGVCVAGGDRHPGATHSRNVSRSQSKWVILEGERRPLRRPSPPAPGRVRLHCSDSDSRGGTRLRGRKSRVGFRPFPPSRSTRLKFNSRVSETAAFCGAFVVPPFFPVLLRVLPCGPECQRRWPGAPPFPTAR